MAIIDGVTQKPFTNGKELQPLLVELIECASFPRPVKINQKIKGLVTSDGITVSEISFKAWFKCICLSSQKVILSTPNGKTKTKYRLKNCIAKLSPEQRTFLVNVMDTTDSNSGNHIFLCRVKTLLEESLNP